MFGAYQAGVWLALQEHFRPDLVVGASVGSLNGWAIAGGISGEDLAAHWRDERHGVPHRWRFPRSIYGGAIDAESLNGWIRDLHAAWTPQCPFGVALTGMWTFQPLLFTAPNVTWRHLAASCGVPLLLPQHRFDGRWYADGGLLAALPVWGAAQMGAERAVCVDLIGGHSRALTFGARLLRSWARFDATPPARLEVLDLSPPERLGPSAEMIVWRRDQIERWIEMGYRTALAKKHLL
jgi:predicted acylesterase/phospholipase RssA